MSKDYSEQSRQTDYLLKEVKQEEYINDILCELDQAYLNIEILRKAIGRLLEQNVFQWQVIKNMAIQFPKCPFCQARDGEKHKENCSLYMVLSGDITNYLESKVEELDVADIRELIRSGDKLIECIAKEKDIPDECKECYPYDPEDSVRFEQRPNYVKRKDE